MGLSLPTCLLPLPMALLCARSAAVAKPCAPRKAASSVACRPAQLGRPQQRGETHGWYDHLEKGQMSRSGPLQQFVTCCMVIGYPYTALDSDFAAPSALDEPNVLPVCVPCCTASVVVRAEAEVSYESATAHPTQHTCLSHPGLLGSHTHRPAAQAQRVVQACSCLTGVASCLLFGCPGRTLMPTSTRWQRRLARFACASPLHSTPA